MGDRPRRALTIGGAMIDTIALLHDDTIERISLSNAHRSYLLLEEGSKTEAELISQHAGGGAVNTAVALSRLGFKVASILKLGRDERGEQVRQTLADEGISAEFVRDTEAAATGSSILVSAHERNAAIFTYRGANGLLTRDDLPAVAFQRDLVYVTGLSNQSSAQFPAIVDLARRAGAFVAVNPGARQLAARGDEFWQAVGEVSMLSVNSDEARLLLPYLKRVSVREGTPALSLRADPRLHLLAHGLSRETLHFSLPDTMRALLSAGVGTVVITDGARGAYAASGTTLAWCPPRPSKVRGTTGAGDGFSSTFAAYACRGAALEPCLRLATVNASSVVSVPDAQSGLMRAEALQAVVDAESATFPVETWRL